MERRNNKDDRIEGTSIRKPGQEKLLFRRAPPPPSKTLFLLSTGENIIKEMDASTFNTRKGEKYLYDLYDAR